MRKLIPSLMSVLLLATLLVGAAGASTTYEIFPFFDQELEVQEGDEIRLRYYWDATSKGQMNMFFNHSTTSIVLTDENDNIVVDMSDGGADDLWSPLELVDAAELPTPLDCPQPKHWYSEVDYRLPDLEPGTYELVSVAIMEQPVNDGWHTCTNLETGEPASAPPSLYPSGTTFAGTVIITVE